MLKSLLVIINVVVTSLYLFPFELKAFPGINTKMVLAAIALFILFFQMIRRRQLTVSKEFLILSFCAAVVSIVGIVSVTYNNTPDYAYASYFISAWVWLGGAYTLCTMIKVVHGSIDWRLVCHYFIFVCVLQCALAMLIDLYQPAKSLVDAIVEQNQDFLNGPKVHRLYGIGASLDVAGSRFSAVIVMIFYLLANSNYEKKWYHYLSYLLAFVVLATVGNMIARTTLVGIVIGLLYLLGASLGIIKSVTMKYFRTWGWIALVVVASIPMAVHFYNTVPEVQKNMRFGYEGFFSLVEKGRWEVTSNDRLKNMYVYPDNMKTWVIGDGYFSNPKETDPQYTGPINEGYYKSTDVGYLRFIFYFGVVGLLAFSWFIIQSGIYCIKKFPNTKMLFLLLLLANFVIWLKVSTDIFLVFAVFFAMEEKKKNEIPTMIQS